MVIFPLLAQKEPYTGSGNCKLKTKNIFKSNTGPFNTGLFNNTGPSNTGPFNTSASPLNAGTEPSNTSKNTAGTSYNKIIPGIFCKTPAHKTPANKKKVVHYSGQINKENHFHLPTIKARHNGMFLYKKRLSTRKLKPGCIKL